MAFLFLSFDTQSQSFYHLHIVFTDKTDPQESLIQETRVEECWNKTFPWSRKTGLENTYANLKSTSPWALSTLGMSRVYYAKESRTVSKTELTCRDGLAKKNSDTT